MKLKGINITSLGAYKNHFEIEEVWENIGNGVLLEFQEKLAKNEEKNAAEEMIRIEMIQILKAYENKDNLTEIIKAFYSNGKWDLSALEKKIEPINSKSRDHDGNNFYTRNMQGIQSFTNGELIDWNDQKAALFYLFLLCFLQAKPQEEITEEAFAFIADKLSEAAYEGEKTQGSKLYPKGSGVLFLKNGKIMNEQEKQISPECEMISCFAYTEDLGLIAFTKQGAFSGCMEQTIRYEIEKKRVDAGTENEKIVMIAAFGEIYALLLENGSILTNVLDSTKGWEEIRWIGAGLNSLTAVRGANRHLLELGSDEGLNDFSNVKAAYTWSADGCRRYAVLRENGDLSMDDKTREKGVSAANISQKGYFFAIGQEIFWKEFDTGNKKKYTLPAEYTITELCECRSNIYCRAKAAAEEKLFAFTIID